MAAYIVTYDLKQAGQNYACVVKKLEAYPVHWHMQGSVWIIQTSKPAAQIRDELSQCLDDNDNLFVGLLGFEAAWTGFSDAGTSWLKKQLQPTV